MKQKLLQKTVTKINFIFVISLLVVVAIAAAGYLCKEKIIFLDPLSQIAVALAQFLYIYTMFSIPLSLYFFKKRSKKWAKMDNDIDKIKRYFRGSYIHTIMIAFGACLGSIIYCFFINSVSMFFCAGISVLALVLCRTSIKNIERDLEIKEEK